jgi:protein-S-isoprenylcysteine O-methyltransferase Ste14
MYDQTYNGATIDRSQTSSCHIQTNAKWVVSHLSLFQMIKGLDQIGKHVPDLNTPLGIVRTFLLTVIPVLLVSAIFTALRFTGPIWQLVVEILFGGLGFFLVWLFFRSKADYQNRFGPLAYRFAAARFGLPGVTIIATAGAHIRYLPGPAFPRFWGDISLPVLGWTLIAAGVLLALRTVQTFGVDNLVMLYVYFPEESQLVNHKIYQILRHPAYGAIQWIAFGLALLNGGWFAFASALIFSLGLWVWVRLVEEKELIVRFGQDYAKYRQSVPAFWPRPNHLRGFFEFLVLGK